MFASGCLSQTAARRQERAMSASHPILESYTTYLVDTDKSSATSAIVALTDDIRRSTATTMMGLRDELRQAGEALKSCPDAPISIGSLCELFVRFVTRIQEQMEDLTDFEAVKRLLVERGETFARTSLDARTQIAQLGAPLIDDGAVVLTHGYSRVLVALFLTAAKTKHFSVMVAESHPDGSGHTTARKLIEKGVPVTVVEDCAVAHVMPRCQMVLCGAEAVVESGGLHQLHQLHLYTAPAPPCTALHRPAPPCTALRRPAPPCTALHRPAPPCTALHRPAPPPPRPRSRARPLMHN